MASAIKIKTSTTTKIKTLLHKSLFFCPNTQNINNYQQLYETLNVILNSLCVKFYLLWGNGGNVSFECEGLDETRDGSLNCMYNSNGVCLHGINSQ